ncbi:MAG: Sensor kinase CckA [Verrucomicrobiae bacterium]|nr:Sensor kinase CckA [Verrucomicrobiae bacterium]
MRRNEAKLTECLELMTAGAHSAASVVRRLRELYRRPGEREALQPVNLSHLVQQVVALTEPRWKEQTIAAGQPVQIVTDLAEVPVIAGNEGELREIVTNLLFNAVDAMPKGGTICLRTCQHDQDVELTVSDTGTGMTPEVRQRCFEMFFTTKGTQGTGLGLATVHAIIQQHDGTLDLQTAPGQGSTFRIRLPIRVVPETSVRPTARKGPDRHGRILLVDDEAILRELFTEYLMQAGHTVVAAADGAAGLEQFQAGPFDLVITDMAMPGLNGEQLAAKIQAVAPSTPVILLTGFGDIMKVQQQRPPGIAVVVGKPVSLSDLHEAVQDALAIQGK